MNSQLRRIQILEKIEWCCIGIIVPIVGALGAFGILAFLAASGIGLIEW